MRQNSLQVFALESSREFGERLAAALELTLGQHEERDFVDGEHKVRPRQNVRGADVFVVQSLYSDEQQSVNDKLIRFLFFLGALKDAAAARVTAVIPYMCYARKERKTKSRDPVNTRYLAGLLEAVGVDRVLTMTIHNLAAYQNAFRIGTDHLDANRLFADHFAAGLADEDLIVVSPDVGGIKRAERFRQYLGARLNRDLDAGFMQKQRSAGVVSGETLVGEAQGKTALIIDDMIAGGTTIARTASACHEHGAERVYAAATHGLFVGDADAKLVAPELSGLVIADTVPPFRLHSRQVTDKLTVLDSASLFGEAIRRIHEGGSIVELLDIQD